MSPDESMPARSLGLQARVALDEAGRLLRVEATLVNAGSHALCLMRSGGGGWDVEGLSLVLLDSFGRVAAFPSNPAVAGRSDANLPTVLPASATLVVSVSGAELGVSPWRNDVYSAVVSIRSPRGLDAVARAAGLPCRAAASRVVNAPVQQFKIADLADQPGVAHYRALWSSTAIADERRRALTWLARNAVARGQSAAQVAQLLGAPADGRKVDRWRYTANETGGGVDIRFVGGKVDRVDWVEH